MALTSRASSGSNPHPMEAHAHRSALWSYRASQISNTKNSRVARSTYLVLFVHDDGAADDGLGAEEGQVGVVEDAAHVGLLLEEAVLAAEVADLVLVGRAHRRLGALACVPVVRVEVAAHGVARARELKLVLKFEL